MANKEAVFSLRVDTGSSVQDVQSFDKAINDLNKDVQNVQKTAQSGAGLDDFDQKMAELNARVEAGGMTMRELTMTMKQYQTIAAQAGMESPVGQQALQAAAQLKDEIGDLKAATTALSSDFVALDTTLAGVETGAAIFQGFQSAIALTGVESEQLVQTMVKLQAVQGVVNAVNTVAKNLNSDAILGIQVRNGLEKIGNFIRTGTITGLTAQATAQGAVTAATASTTLAMKALRTAIIATGIGALVIGLIAAADALGFFGDESEKAEKAQKKLDDQLKLTNDRLQEQSNYTNDLVEGTARDTERLVAQAKLRGASEAEITKIKKDQSDIQRRLLANDVEFQKKEYYKALNNRKINLEQLTKFEETYFGAKKKLALFDSKATQDALNDQVKAQEDAQEKQKKAQEKAAEAAKKAAEQRKEDLKLITDAEKEFALSSLSDKEQEIIKEEEKFSKLIKLAQKYGYDTTNLRLALKNAINDIEAKYAQQELDLADQVQKEKRQKEIETFNRKEALRREEIAAEEAFYDEYNAALLTQQQAEELAVTDKYFNLIEQAKKYGLDTAALEEKQQKELADIRKKYDAENLQKKIDIGQQILSQVSALNSAIADIENARLQELQNQTDAQLASLDQAQQQELNSSNLTAEQRAAIDKKYAAAKYAIELKNFQEVEKIKKQQFERDKALRIAQVAIDTATAIVKGIAQFGPPPSPAGIAAIASAAIIGATQIAAIAAQKYQSGTAPSLNTGGGGVSVGATAGQLGGNAANANLNTQQQNTAELIAQSNQGALVYVLESDITGTQNKVAMQNKLSVW